MQRLLEDSTASNMDLDDGKDFEIGKNFKLGMNQRITCFEDQNKSILWSFRNNPNAEDFRRCMLPFYLLKEDKDWAHPRYIEHSNLA